MNVYSPKGARAKAFLLLSCLLLASALLHRPELSDAGDQAGIAYVVKPGDTLADLAAHFYGNRAFMGLISLQNSIATPHNLKAGATIEIPTLSAMLDGARVDSSMSACIDSLLSAWDLYHAIADTIESLWFARLYPLCESSEDAAIPIPAYIPTRLVVVAGTVDRVRAVFERHEIANDKLFKSSVRQLRSAREELLWLSQADSLFCPWSGKAEDTIVQRFAYTMNNIAEWIRKNE